MLKCFIPLAIEFFFLISCSDVSGNKSVAPMNNENVESPVTFSFNTYNGLVAEEPCSENLRDAVAHINESNLDYICVFDEALMVWSWKMLGNSSVEPISVQSSSSNNSMVLQYSSSSNYFLSSAVEPAYSSIAYPKSSSGGVSSAVMQIQSSSSKANWAYLNPAISYGEMQIYLETYKTVTIGSQTWMAENMYDLGTKCRGYNSKKYNMHGCLFSWEDAMSICPKGWRLPDSVDFAELKSLHGAERLASRIWKEEYITYDGEKKSFYGSDDYGFSALPVGYTTGTGLILNTLEGEGTQALFWTSKKVYPSSSGNMRWAFSIHANTRMTGMGFTSLSEACGLAVRCIKDEW